MRRALLASATFCAASLLALSAVHAQPDKGGKGGGESVDDFVKKLMTFDKDKDGKLTKEELTDTRLHALFERADTKKTGYVTRVELEALYARENLPGGGFGFKDKKGGFFDKKKKGPPKKGPPPPDF